jgi:hypothetical protein
VAGLVTKLSCYEFFSDGSDFGPSCHASIGGTEAFDVGKRRPARAGALPGDGCAAIG